MVKNCLFAGNIPKYPSILSISNVNSKRETIEDYLGEYMRLSHEVFNDRPTWKNSFNNRRVFFQGRLKDPHTSIIYTTTLLPYYLLLP